jgi:hypothetical protein
MSVQQLLVVPWLSVANYLGSGWRLGQLRLVSMQQPGFSSSALCAECFCCFLFACAVDNVILRDPPVLGVPLLAGLNLVPGAPQQPCPGEE